MRRCNIVTGRTCPLAQTPERADLLQLSVRIETDGVSPEALADFKLQVPGTQRHYAGYDEPAEMQDFAWYVAPHAVPQVRDWAVKWFKAAYLQDGPREENLHTGRVVEQGGLFG